MANSSELILSPAATDWIRQKLEFATREPRLANLVAGLHPVERYTVTDPNGQVIENCERRTFDIGWYTQEVVRRNGFVQLSCLPIGLLVEPEALEQLAGKQLVLQAIPVGHPEPAHKLVNRLIAIEKET